MHPIIPDMEWPTNTDDLTSFSSKRVIKSFAKASYEEYLAGSKRSGSFIATGACDGHVHGGWERQTLLWHHHVLCGKLSSRKRGSYRALLINMASFCCFGWSLLYSKQEELVLINKYQKQEGFIVNLLLTVNKYISKLNWMSAIVHFTRDRILVWLFRVKIPS